MRIVSKLTGGIAAAALIGATAGPASAQGWGPPRHYHDRGPDAGTIIGAIAAVGLIAAIASAASSSSSKNSQADTRRYDTPPPTYDGPRTDQGYDDRYDNRGDSGANYDGRNDAGRPDAGRGTVSAEDAAVNSCVLAARDQASRNGDYVEIRGVDGASPKGSGWDITGRLDQRASYRSNDGWSRNFRCSWQDGQVTGLTLN